MAVMLEEELHSILKYNNLRIIECLDTELGGKEYRLIF